MIDLRGSLTHVAVVAVLVLVYVEVALVLTNYGSVWVQPEEFEWRTYILMDGTALAKHDLIKGLNWRVFEYEPRSTRPLSHYFEIVDTKFRAALWTFLLPHPSLSLTWIFLLWVTPLFFFRLLRNLEVPPLLAGMLTAWSVGNPGTLSLAAADFRPAKPLANFAIVCCLYWASRIHTAPREERGLGDESFYWLCVFMLSSFLVDETAILAFPAVLLLFPRVVFRNARRTVAFLLLPAAAYLLYFRAIPALTAIAGFDLPKLDTYGPAKAVTTPQIFQYVLFSPKVLGDFATNATIFVSDSLGLVNPALSRSGSYTLLWWSVIACLAAVALRIGLFAYRAGWRSVVRAEVARAFVLLVGVTFFANFTLHLVTNRFWGLHWLNTYWSIFWLLFLALALKPLDFHPLFALAAASLIATTSTYDFTAMNRAFKSFFYYRTVVMEDVLTHKVNRFAIPPPDGAALRERTRTIWRNHGYVGQLNAIPTELYYLLPDLGLIEPGVTHDRQGTLFNGRVSAFDLVKPHGPKDKYFVVQPAGWERRVSP